jgi:ubiquilin
MREHMRNNDRAMSNLEALPGGFNALRQLYENVQEPLMSATQGMGAGGDVADNPLAGMLAAMGGGAAAAGGAAGGAAAGGAAAANPGETQPLPNPWAGGGGGGGGAGGPAGLGALGGLGGMGGMGAGGFPMGAMDPGMQSAMMQQVRRFAVERGGALSGLVYRGVLLIMSGRGCQRSSITTEHPASCSLSPLSSPSPPSCPTTPLCWR